MTWIVRYFRLRHVVREFARRLKDAPEKLGSGRCVSTEQLAIVGRMLEDAIDGDGRWSDCSRGA